MVVSHRLPEEHGGQPDPAIFFLQMGYFLLRDFALSAACPLVPSDAHLYQVCKYENILEKRIR